MVKDVLHLQQKKKKIDALVPECKRVKYFRMLK